MLREALMGLVRGYRLLLSPWLGSACRFEPTCSAYATEAIQRFGVRRGSWLAAKRLGRCLMLREPDTDRVREHAAHIDKITETIARGSLTLGQEESRSATLDARAMP